MTSLVELERKILGEVWTSPALWENITYLCDTCNGRFAGTEDEQRAGDFLLERFRDYGLENVAAEPFEMTGWRRGETRLTLVDGHLARDLPCLAMVGSPAGEVEALLVDTGPGAPADLERLGSEVAGKVALTGPEGPHRLEKYAEAHTAGAVGIIFASGQPGMLASVGSLNLRTMPAALPAVSAPLETVSFLRRRLQEGPVRVRLTVGGGPQRIVAHNIVAELPGADPNAGWIVACGHYDGHDVAQGAQDNATGTVALLEAARLLAPLRSHLKAGIRFVLFSGEELGIHGSPAYVRDHADELDHLRVALNADIVGIAPPLLLHTQNSPELAAYLRQLPLEDLGAAVKDSGLVHNTDHFAFTLAGIASLWAVTSPAPSGQGWVHTAADTLDKVDVRLLREATATIARVLLRMALEPEKLPQGRKPPETVRQAVAEAGLEKILRLQGRWPF